LELALMDNLLLLTPITLVLLLLYLRHTGRDKQPSTDAEIEHWNNEQW
jgi:hypothetical protein